MTDFDRELAARTTWMEARGEGASGIDAVAHVLVNRVRAGRWGASLASVCLAPYQFSCWNTADPNRSAMAKLADDDAVLAQCRAAVGAALAGAADPTGGATHYVTKAVLEQMAPPWTSAATRCAEIGHHVFFKNVA